MKVLLIISIAGLMLVGCTSENNSITKTRDEKVTQSKSNNQKWQLDEVFKVTVKDAKGNPSSRTLIGKEKHLAFLPAEGKPYFIAGENKKYLWIFWGKPEKFQNGKLKVEAIKKDTGKNITVVKGPIASGQYVGDASAPTSMSIPSAGIWKLNVYINESYFGNIIVQVNDK